jgi:hypothetical protein
MHRCHKHQHNFMVRCPHCAEESIQAIEEEAHKQAHAPINLPASDGMTIRQYYAAAIMNGLVTKWGIEQVNDAEIMRVFSIADRMAKFEKDGN